jgi:hypothetical protein
VKKLLFIYLLFYSIVVFSQRKNENFKYNIIKSSTEINIDGSLDESSWTAAQLASDFFMILPMDTSKANMISDVKMTYDDQNIYIAVKNYIPHKTYAIESLRRDWNFQKNDNFVFAMDTYNDITNGFAFGVNAAGAQWDGQQFDGAAMNLNWDNKWTSVVKQFDDYWIFEAAIPFKSIRFNKDLKSWGINFSRNDLASTEKSSWAPVPRQFPSISSAYMGQLIWDQPPPKVGSNISVIPFVLSGINKDYSENKKADSRSDVGVDTKLALGSALNLDLTINPDFSQVEVDRQQTNLDRFELFFPERRQFFLENDDLFNNLGLERIRPFFSRRIGFGVPINYGARLSGKLNKNLRIGVMNIKTGQNEEGNIGANNFSVLTLQQKLFSRSNITGFIINKDELRSNKFNRNAGLEYNLSSKNNLWRGKFLYYNSMNQEKLKGNTIFAGTLNYTDRNWNISGQYEKVGDNYIAEVGFVQRKSYSRINPRIGYSFLPKKGKVLSHGPSFFEFSYMDKNFKTTEYTYGLSYNVDLRNKANISCFMAKDYIQLLSDFDPTNLTGIKLKTGSEHHWRSMGLFYTSQPQSLFTYGFESRYGGYYANGTRLRLAANIAYRFQPFVQLALAAEINDINLPEEQGLQDAKFFLVSPRIDVTFTNNLYFTTFLQYNEQIKNTNVNARLQWRYKPVSDIYLVYTDNYDITNGSVKNRAVVLKATYWWNI